MSATGDHAVATVSFTWTVVDAPWRGRAVGGVDREDEVWACCWWRSTGGRRAREVRAGAEEAVESGHGQVGGDVEQDLVRGRSQRHGGGGGGGRAGMTLAGRVIRCTAVDGHGDYCVREGSEVQDAINDKSDKNMITA